jgi:solute carrier family 35 protein
MLQYAIFICTYHNSALTTTVIGCLKNVLTTYMGMLFLSDYVFSLKNFVGVNVSILGSILYIYTVTNKSKGNGTIKMTKGGGRGGAGGVGTTKPTGAGKKQGYWG